MFIKAYVLSETDFRSWLLDVDNLFVQEYDVQEYSIENYGRAELKELYEDFLITEFDVLLSEGGVDELVVFVGGDVYEIDSGHILIDLVERKYGIDKRLKDMGYEVEDFGEKRVIRKSRKRLLEKRMGRK